VSTRLRLTENPLRSALLHALQITKQRTAAHPFEHTVMVRSTDLRPLRPANANVREQFHELYEELIADGERDELICGDVLQTLREGRSPMVLTERNEHLDSFAKKLTPEVRHLVVLRGGMRKKELDSISARLAAIPAQEPRVILATGRYVGEGFDDARLDTLFLTLPISWRGTIAQYGAGAEQSSAVLGHHQPAKRRASL